MEDSEPGILKLGSILVSDVMYQVHPQSFIFLYIYIQKIEEPGIR